MDLEKDKLLITFGKHIKDLRLKLDLTQDDIVNNSSKITKGTVSDIENGKRNFAFTTLVDLAKGLGKSPKELLDFDFDVKKYK